MCKYVNNEKTEMDSKDDGRPPSRSPSRLQEVGNFSSSLCVINYLNNYVKHNFEETVKVDYWIIPLWGTFPILSQIKQKPLRAVLITR